jgi:hypothetical protein
MPVIHELNEQLIAVSKIKPKINICTSSSPQGIIQNGVLCG